MKKGTRDKIGWWLNFTGVEMMALGLVLLRHPLTIVLGGVIAGIVIGYTSHEYIDKSWRRLRQSMKGKALIKDIGTDDSEDSQRD